MAPVGTGAVGGEQSADPGAGNAPPLPSRGGPAGLCPAA